MIKPRLILHIGTHKTGTTTIQKTLEAQRESLLAQGILYPATDREPWPQLPKHCSVFAAAARGDAAQAQAERDWLIGQLHQANAHTLIVSEEGLSEPQPRLAAFFAPLVSTFDIQVVCMFRRPDLFTESLYNQFVRVPGRCESRPILKFSRSKDLRERLDYAGILDHWRKLGATVTAVNFDQAIRTSKLLRVFSQACNIPPLPAENYRANSSPDMRLVLLLCRLNKQQLSYKLPSLIKASRILEAERRFPRLRHLLGRTERASMLDELAHGLARLRHEYGIAFLNDLPPDESNAAIEDIDMNYTMELLTKLS